jgi:pimeloyl-ACP methyl ester carboxylesterase
MNLLAAVAIALVALLALVAAVSALPGTTAPITDAWGRIVAGSVAELEMVTLGGVPQGLLVRGWNVSNPVLLFLHGGPGTSELGMLRTYNLPALEQHFTVAVWDQRGAARSFAAIEPASGMTVEQLIADTHEAAELLRRRFRQEKIYLAGHSWGSLLGALTVQRHPELFHAFVGIGQAVTMQEGERISWDWTLEQAQKAGDARSVAKLQKIGRPPYTGDLRSKVVTQRAILAKYGGEVHGNPRGGLPIVLSTLLKSSEYGWRDRFNFFRGIFATMRLMWPQLLELDLVRQAPELKVPVYFLEGRHDYEAPSILAERYFDLLRAPRKELVWFERSAHFVNTEEPDAFNRFFVERLLRETRPQA